MTSIAIITDDASQCFLDTDPVDVNFLQIKHRFSNLKTANQPKKDPEQFFPDFLPLKSSTIISPPNKEVVSAQLVKLMRDFDEIFCITVTRGIDSIYSIFEEMSIKQKGRANFHLIDSQTLSAGQGYLVHRTIQLMQQNIPALKIEEILREEIPGIYTLLCTPNLSYLYASGFVDAGQVISGEQYTLYPIFGLEDGNFTALEKQKNIHGAIEYFIEFISEYDQLKEVVFLHPFRHPVAEAINFEQYLHENLPNVHYSEINCNEFMTHLIGPRGFGLIVIE
jgi:fatty acid-binding protein DegV